MTALLGIVALVVIGIPLTLLSGVVFADFWEWFIIPVFSAPPVTYMQAIGIMLTASLLKMGLATTAVKDETEHPIKAGFAKQFGYTFALLLVWGIGAIWHLFI